MCSSDLWSYAIWLKPWLGFPTNVSGQLALPSIFGDNMVLQRDVPVPIWGTAHPAANIIVNFFNAGSAQTKRTKADARGQWRVALDPLKADDRPSFLLVTSGYDTTYDNHPGGVSNAVMLRDVLVGDVWFCSGQSNMEYSMRKNSKF